METCGLNRRREKAIITQLRVLKGPRTPKNGTLGIEKPYRKGRRGGKERERKEEPSLLL